MSKISKILIANRGEIALRVIKTAKKLGIKSVAVYSDVDKDALHVLEADEAVHIGPSTSADSYLVIDKIIEAAMSTHCDAIHPGYGFLSENAEFARQVKENNIIFIGPSASSIEMMGDKLSAKEAVSAYNIPMVPGTSEPVSDVEKIKVVANEIGYPILIKASAGGGGKGMRVVYESKNIEEELNRAQSEALSAFGNDAVFIEKYLLNPRHIEIQILADNFGHTIHLNERECSIQRRHQKVIEEAPSSVLTNDLREKMGEDAIKVATSCNYSGAGTVEFLVDKDNNYYFLEINTRLQVEHPVSELITGIDLVEEQIKVAENQPLTIKQEDIKINGHAIELRIYAEDPLNNFLPTIGSLDIYKEPKGSGIRVDSGYRQGTEIPIYYDPMIAKLIYHGATREEAIQGLLKAISNFRIEGIQTTLPFGTFVLQNEHFIKGDFDTNFVNKYFSTEIMQTSMNQDAYAAALIGLHLFEEKKSQVKVSNQSDNAWSERH